MTPAETHELTALEVETMGDAVSTTLEFTLAPHSGGGAGQALTLVLNLAGCDPANVHRKPGRVGRGASLH